MKRELLREPDRVLLDRGPDAPPPADLAPPREKLVEPSLDLR